MSEAFWPIKTYQSISKQTVDVQAPFLKLQTFLPERYISISGNLKVFKTKCLQRFYNNKNSVFSSSTVMTAP